MILPRECGAIQHLAPILYVSYVPPAKILIKGTGTLKHPSCIESRPHIFNIRNIPIPYILIKGLSIVKHPGHVSDITTSHPLISLLKEAAQANIADISSTFPTFQLLRSPLKEVAY